jgi:hypothetical protein
MSADLADEVDTLFTEKAVRLMKEYCDKLDLAVDQSRKLLAQGRPAAKAFVNLPPASIAHRDNLFDFVINLQAPAQELARLVSGQIEAGRLEALEKAELRLRLAEFEHKVRAALQTVNELHSLK